MLIACLGTFALGKPPASRSSRFRLFLSDVFLSLLVGIGEITDRASFAKNAPMALGLFVLALLCVLPIRAELQESVRAMKKPLNIFDKPIRMRSNSKS